MVSATPAPTLAPMPTPTVSSAEAVVFDVDAAGYLVDRVSRRAIWLTDNAGTCYRLKVNPR